MRRTALVLTVAAVCLTGGAGAWAAGLGLGSTSLRAFADNSVVVPKVADSLSATATPATLVAPLGAGATATSTAVLSGGTTAPPVTGTISYVLSGVGDTTCTLPPAFTTTRAVTGNGTYVSPPYAPTTAGTYRWTVSFGGDARNAAAPIPVTCGNGGTLDVTVPLVNIASASAPPGGNTKATIAGTASPNTALTLTVCAVNFFPCMSPVVTASTTAAANGTWSTLTGNLGVKGTLYVRAVQSTPPSTSAVFTFTSN